MAHVITSLKDHKFLLNYPANNTTLTEIYLLLPFSSAFFPFSPAAFESRLLTVLHLKLCIINGKYIRELPCLKELCFDRINTSTTELSKFISGTLLLPLFHRSASSNQLKKVRVDYAGLYLQAIEIKARNLTEFNLFTSSNSLEFDLRACTKLQVLELDCECIPIGFPNDISLEFPRLKSLSLRLFKRRKKIKLLSRELEDLTLSDMLDLDDAVIDTPNLRLFKLMNMEKVEIGMKNARTMNSLLELRTFAENLGKNITLSFDTTELKEVISHSKNLRSNIGPLRIKHITLEVLSSLIPGYESFIDELFSYFHPRTFLVRVDSDVLNCNFIRVFCNLMCSNPLGRMLLLYIFQLYNTSQTN